MDSELKFKRIWSLQSLAATRTVIHLWETPGVQQKITKYFFYPSQKKWRERDKWNLVCGKVNCYLKSCHLPAKITMELNRLIELIGDKIFCWYEYVMIDLGLDLKFASKRYWTSYGEMDEDKIFKNYWQIERGFHSSKHRIYGLGSTLYMVACIHAQVDFIKKNLEEMTAMINEHMNRKDVYTVPEIIAAWLKYYLLISENSLVWSTAGKEGLNKAAKLLWQEDNSEQVALACLENADRRYFNRYRKDKFIDMFLYLIERMPQEEKINFLFSNIKSVVKAFLRVYPYQWYLLEILNFLKTINSSKLYEEIPKLLDAIINIGRERNWFLPKIYRTANNCVFVNILRMMPRDLRIAFLLDDEYNVCSRLFECSNYEILCEILNDPNLSEIKDEVIDKGDKLLRMYAETSNLQEINVFMERVKLTESEIQKMKDKYNILSNSRLMAQYIANGMQKSIEKLISWLTDSETEKIRLKKQMDSAKIVDTLLNSTIDKGQYQCEWDVIDLKDLTKLDQYLEWQFDSKQEIVDFKSKLDLVEIYRKLISRDCPSSETFNSALLDELLIWQFSADEQDERNKMKQKIGSDEFVFKQVCRFWNLNYFKSKEESSKTECSKFLNWIFDSDEVMINQKKLEIVQHGDFIQFFCDRIFADKEKIIDSVDKFLDFCGCDPEKKKDIKRNVKLKSPTNLPFGDF